MEAIQAYKRRTFDLLEVKAGHHILDVSCGTGDDVRTLEHHGGNKQPV